MNAKLELQGLVGGVESALAAVKIAVEALPDSDPQVEELQKKIDALNAQIADLSLQLEQAKAALASEDELLKADEAKIQKLRDILFG